MIPHDQIQPDEYLNQIANFYRSSRCSNDLPSGYDSQKKRTGKWPIEIVDLPMTNGGSFHRFL